MPTSARAECRATRKHANTKKKAHAEQTGKQPEKQRASMQIRKAMQEQTGKRADSRSGDQSTCEGNEILYQQRENDPAHGPYESRTDSREERPPRSAVRAASAAADVNAA
eukprot:CAMPEP_0182834718 /NCGR_PEP_ID=MMETSP0006_2-20121128/21083_1 /TAXON_ID=97485 /ORGANISM="Prymnesium parvum, Strain Texoma1" /LENGTH=109 /DNA_ID=CAMNT_0024963021 /DNA_START=70 /DNA_END=399 /DNA_ORIENTATION=+